ncbi:hypothetical protein ACJ73_04218 [Blastomyces percursus]|uniref:JmjC domain-containing protein n=1 Tax=Blastomyces percursus TaxID=1658174 RepID=A0A1J9R8V4_9EURO|nr:hypothetical protein ACJ73_04218 [Blastomyces percursus]
MSANVHPGELGHRVNSVTSTRDIVNLDEWISDPQGYTGGRWRYVVLQPGQTIFFTSGTIHYVFRLSKGQTLMFGGHILQWSIERWMEVIIAQTKNPDITNEDMESSVGKYIEAVVDLVHEERSVRNLDKETARKFLKHVNVSTPRSYPYPTAADNIL